MVRKKTLRKPAIEEDTSNLPWEIIYIILSKLPVKSLLRFKCVCKPWLALISEPQFIKSHLSEAVRSDRQRVICYSLYNSDCFYKLGYETCGPCGKSVDVELLYLPPIKKYQNISVLCSCNGLVLLALGFKYRKIYVLWNPSTREYQRFSCPYSNIVLLNYFYAICYDSSIGDYKVLIINSDGNIMVYTRKTTSWTEIKGFPHLMPRDDWVTVSGVPHWIVALKKGGHSLGYLLQMYGLRGGNNDHSLTPIDDQLSKASDYDKAFHEFYTIVYFDLVEEKIKEVPPPKWMCEGDSFDLTVIGGCLGLYINSSDRHKVDVWVMEEYGVRNSWTKYFTIPRRVGSTHLYNLKPLCYTKKGEVVLIDNSRVVLYDPKEGKLRNTTHSTGIIRCPSRAIFYVDSLVCPLVKKQYKRRENGKMKQL